MRVDFDEEERKEITRQALQLVKRGYLTGVNFIHSESPLPKTAVIIHYLQDSQSQIDFMCGELKKFGTLDILLLPRLTQYLFDPVYVKKPSFWKEYKHAQFVDEHLRPKSIEEVAQHPEGTIVLNNEHDVLIPLESGNITKLVKYIQEADRSGPSRWLHPAIIVKGNMPVPIVPEFVMKDYASVSRSHAEFYSLVADEQRKQRLLKRLEAICQQLQTSTQAQLLQDAVLLSPSQINPELDSYINENQRELDLSE